jgi:hypothetical protein
MKEFKLSDISRANECRERLERFEEMLEMIPGLRGAGFVEEQIARLRKELADMDRGKNND